MITNKNILDLEKRSSIYNFILKNPGLHVREIERKSKIPKSTLVHHLKFLEKRELIKSSKEHGYTRYYAKGKLGKRQKKIISTLRQEIPFKIVIRLLAIGSISSRRELSSELERHPNTISFHLNKLEKAGIIEESPIIDGMGIRTSGIPVRIGESNKNQKIYRLVNPIEIHNILITNKENLFEKHKESYKIILWNLEYYLPKTKSPPIGNDFDSNLERTFARIYDVFPHPYHI